MNLAPLFIPFQNFLMCLGRVALAILALQTFLIIDVTSAIYAQTSPITSSGLNTQVSAPEILPGGVVKHNITGGTRPGGGANLFHSFGEFGVPTNNIANFLNDSALPTTNILSRVTGGNPSNIFGRIQTTEGFGNANLFLMNPAGIVFGPDASLNVRGATHFTTADYLRLSDGVQFTALPGAQDALLSIAPVAAFGFLGSNASPISVEGSTLSVSEGQTLSLVGGDVTIGSNINAPEGKIAIASVASPGEVLAGTYASAPNINGQSFTTMGNIALLDGATVDVSDNAAGSVIIRGGNLMMTNATISANTVESDGAPIAVDIQVTGDLTITDTQGTSAITAQTTGSGNAGEVRISSTNVVATSSSLVEDPFSLIDTHTSGSGTGGNVNLMVTDTIQATGEHAGSLFLIDSGAINENGGHGGDVIIETDQLLLTDANINTGDFIGQIIGGPTGSGGNLTIIADTVQLTSTTLATDGSWDGKAGDMNITARDIQLKDFSSLVLSEFGGGGTLHITTNSLLMDASGIDGGTFDGRGVGVPWDGMTITADRIELRNGSTIKHQTFGDGAAGNIRITAANQIIMSDDPTTSGTVTQPSGVFTNSFGDEGFGDQGPAGTIFIETGQLELSGGARIDSTTQSSGRGGDVTLTVTNGISMSGARPAFPDEQPITSLGSTRASGIFSRTVGSEFCTGPCGDAGNISIATGFLNVTEGAAINSGTTSTGKGGTITVNASDNISISGKIDDGIPGGVYSRTTGSEPGSGEGGDITLTAGDSFFLKDGATVSASSSGPGNAGNIHITAHDTILIEKATVTTDASQASGGNIKLTANDTIQLVDSTIESSVEGDENTKGGNINLDPDFIILQNSWILAKAGAGQGGNISLIASKAVFADPFSEINASAETGVSGFVTIQSPIQNLSSTITPLPQNTLPVTALYGSRCVAEAGGNFSTFVDSRAGSLAPSPGTFLASPFLPLSNPPHAGTVGKAGTLREITEKEQAMLPHLASYAPPLLFAQADGMSSACP